MTTGPTVQGWTLLVAAWSVIIGLFVFCFSKVLLSKKKKDNLLVTDTGREQWGSRIGLILAMAGNAIGLGNFLRFPVKAAAYGGGAFMIPYFCALVFLGIPLMWVEWTIGRHGGIRGHGTSPGMLQAMHKNRSIKYIGAIGLLIPFTIVVYYTFIESWTLAYAWFSLTGKYFGHTSSEAMSQFLAGYQGKEANEFFPGVGPMIIFLVITMITNYYFLYKGLSRGIEVLAKIGMPILFVFAVVLAIRVFTLGTPNPAIPENNVLNGLAFMWNPDFSRLREAEVWLVAAGQIFFTLSLGQGILLTYSSYLRENDDLTLNGLSTSITNEFAEIVLGGTIAIPLAVAFFGIASTQLIAQEGAFNLGFISLPVIFQQIPMGRFFGAMWFFLLFIAGITSSVALASPAIAFLQDEFKWKRTKAVNVVSAVWIACTVFVVIFFKYGFLDELDYWAGTFGLVILATIEIVLFAWVFGIKKGWEEMHKGADLKVPSIFKYIILIITPAYLFILLGSWTYQEAIGKLVMRGENPANVPYLWIARILLVVLLGAILFLIHNAWKKNEKTA